MQGFVLYSSEQLELKLLNKAEQVEKCIAKRAVLFKRQKLLVITFSVHSSFCEVLEVKYVLC